MRIRWFLAFENSSISFILFISFALLFLVGLVDYVTGAEYSVSIIYFAPIALAAWYGKRWAAGLVCFAAAAIWLAADLIGPHLHSKTLVPYWNGAIRLGTFLLVAFFIRALREALSDELALAAEIQSGLLPKTIPDIEGLSLATVMLPSHSVTGDYYDFLRYGDKHLGFCIADVVGHGIPAALLMSNLQSAVRILASEEIAPNDLAERINRIVMKNTSRGKFISFFYGLIDMDSRILTYANAGHHPPILTHNDGSSEKLETGGTLLGLSDEQSFQCGTVKLQSGDRVLLYTDGVIESVNRRGQEFGVDGLKQILDDQAEFEANDLLSEILKALKAHHSGPIQDDVTLIVLAIE